MWNSESELAVYSAPTAVGTEVAQCKDKAGKVMGLMAIKGIGTRRRQPGTKVYSNYNL